MAASFICSEMNWLWDQATSEIFRNYLFVAGGAFGLWLAWLRVTASNRQAENQLKQTELARRDHVAELFNRAVGQLKDKKLEVRLGAILTLEQVCKDFPDLSGPVIKLLTTYLKQNVVRYGDKTAPADVQAIMDILQEFKK
jgi:hypothetical protein